MKRKYLFLLVLFFLPLILLCQDLETSLPTEVLQDYKITFFEPKDLSRDVFLVSVKTTKPSVFINELKEKKWAIRLEVTKIKKRKPELIESKQVTIYTDILTHFIRQNLDDPNQVMFEVEVYSKLEKTEANVHLIRVDRKEEIIDSYTTNIPERFSDPEKQPLISSIRPAAGKKGDTITVIGSNFGTDIDNILVYFGENTEEEGFIELFERKPLSLSAPDEEKKQELRFHIPTRIKFQNQFAYRKKLYFKITVGGRPTGLHEIIVLSDNWKLWIGLFSLLMLFLLYLGLAYILKKFNFWNMILIDKTTNTYSLSRFQAMLWTVVLLGGYFYIAISNGLLLGNGTIPDFNPSLIGLLSISYIGMIGASGVGNKKPKNEIIETPPSLSNLFTSGGSIDIARLQLFGFTIVGVIIYLYNLITTNPLNGLPDIPTTLLGLMGVSQTGYLGGKVIGDKTVVNMVKPFYVPAKQEGVSIQLIGAGFVKNSKILIDEISEPLETTFVSSTILKVELPPLYTLGKKNLTILPNDSTSIQIENCFEVIAIEPNEVPANAGCVISVSILGLDDNFKLTVYGDSEEEYECVSIKNTNFGVEVELPPMLTGWKWFSFLNEQTNKTIEIANAIHVYPIDDSFIDSDVEPPEGWEDEQDMPSSEESGGETISFDVKTPETETKTSSRKKKPFNVTEFTINP